MTNRDRLMEYFLGLDMQEFIELVPCRTCKSIFNYKCNIEDSCPNDKYNSDTIIVNYSEYSDEEFSVMVKNMIEDYPKEFLEEEIPLISWITEETDINKIKDWIKKKK